MSRNRAIVAATLATDHLEARWDAERLEHNLARVSARAVTRARLRRASGAAAVVMVLALVAFASLRGQPAVSARLSAPRPLELPSAAMLGAKTTFVDGSVARVSGGGELVVRLATPLHIESTLLAGSADFEVTKRPERDFVVDAGPVKVRVVGTRFRVERLGERTRVSVSEGKVEVREVATATFLEAGESRFFPSLERSRARASGAESERSRFLELSRGGKYKDAYRLLSQSPGVVGSSAEELMLAADAARLSNHPEQAVGYLRRVTSEHAADSRAPLSAFTLGRVLLSQLGRPAEAAEAFALARRLKPSGSLAEDALAREAEARAQSGGKASARMLATDYLTRYPQGKHAATMQRIVARP